jgi:SulP family sulfate permease
MQIFNEINLRNIRGDLFGGITAAVVALPMALAFGVASGAGAEAGLYGAILVGLFAALFGGSPCLISEPTGPMTVVFTAVITKLIAVDPVNGMAMAFTVVILAGLFQIALGILRLGKYVTLMPYTVVSGFMSGIGIILIILQLAPSLGVAVPPGGVVGVLQGLPEMIAGIQPQETILALGTLAILYLFPARMSRYIPVQLAALAIVTVASLVLMDLGEVRRIGEIPSGLPEFRMPVFSIDQWQIILVDAIVLGVLGCIDALLTSVVADSLTRQKHNSDKELVGQGIANVMSGLFGGLPGAGATMGTVVSIHAGARTALAGLVRVAILVIVVLWAAGLTAVIPMAVLAGIAIKVGINIIDWGFLKRAHRISPKGSFITYGVILLTVFVDLVVAVGIGLFVANVMTVMRLSELQATDVEAITDPDEADFELTSRERDILRAANNKVLLLYMRGSIIFGASRAISRSNSQVEGLESMVIDMTDVRHLGVSSAFSLEEAILDMVRAGRAVYVAGVHDQAYRRMQNMGLMKYLPEDHFIESRVDALQLAVVGKTKAAKSEEESTEDSGMADDQQAESVDPDPDK